MTLVDRIAAKILDRLHHRTIWGNGGPYLSKFRLLNLGKDRLRIYLHRFYRSDEDLELHSHPWEWSFSIILRGGYVETREDGQRTYLPGSFNFIRKDDFHRVELLNETDGAWTLFVAGPEIDTWYFMDPISKLTTPYKKFLQDKGLTVEAPVAN